MAMKAKINELRTVIFFFSKMATGLQVYTDKVMIAILMAIKSKINELRTLIFFLMKWLQNSLFLFANLFAKSSIVDIKFIMVYRLMTKAKVRTR